MIINSLTSENRELKNSIFKVNQEIQNINSEKEKCLNEMNSYKSPQKAENEIFLYSNG